MPSYLKQLIAAPSKDDPQDPGRQELDNLRRVFKMQGVHFLLKDFLKGICADLDNPGDVDVTAEEFRRFAERVLQTILDLEHVRPAMLGELQRRIAGLRANVDVPEQTRNWSAQIERFWPTPCEPWNGIEESFAVLRNPGVRQHTIYFPTAQLVDKNPNGSADLWRLSVWCIPAPTGESEDQNTTEGLQNWEKWWEERFSQHRIVLAPWSPVLIESVVIAAVNEKLLSLAEFSEWPTRFVISVDHVGHVGTAREECLPVEGDSLTVAILLAAWAAQEHRELKTIVVTAD
ncbi:MAG: hypothetical protein KDA66_19445, partial [Planctomycetaceae bacterium]|nr:hypothetical protein [Planctomycetaceae bacterium]